MGTNVFKSIGRCRVLEVLGTAGLVLAGLAWAAACKSPAASEKPDPIITYTYGLIDNFESGTIDSTIWRSNEPRALSIKQDNTGNRYLESNNSLLQIDDTGTVFPDVFDRMSARMMIPTEQPPFLHSGALVYRAGIFGHALNTAIRVGIKRDSSGRAFIFGDWINNTTGELGQSSGPVAQFDRWYTVEMAFVIPGDGRIHIVFRTNGQIFGDLVPSDSGSLLDRTKIAYVWRNLEPADNQLLGDLGQAKIGCFDDIWGIKVKVSKIRAASRWDTIPTPLEFLGPPSDAEGMESFPGLNRTDGRAPEAAPAREKQ
jgi:hypothetical protein